MSWSDARYFIDPVKKLFEAVDDIEEVLPEIEDLTDAEYDELVEYVKGKWNYDEENLDWIVDTAIEGWSRTHDDDQYAKNLTITKQFDILNLMMIHHYLSQLINQRIT